MFPGHANLFSTTYFHTELLKHKTLTPSLLLHSLLSLLLSPLGLLHLLMLPTLVEVLHHHTDKHVQHEEAHDQQEGDEVQQHPRVIVGDRLQGKH